MQISPRPQSGVYTGCFFRSDNWKQPGVKGKISGTVILQKQPRNHFVNKEYGVREIRRKSKTLRKEIGKSI